MGLSMDGALLKPPSSPGPNIEMNDIGEMAVNANTARPPAKQLIRNLPTAEPRNFQISRLSSQVVAVGHLYKLASGLV
jgi:hypothetical protein